jgi:hypothetical protein
MQVFKKYSYKVIILLFLMFFVSGIGVLSVPSARKTFVESLISHVLDAGYVKIDGLDISKKLSFKAQKIHIEWANVELDLKEVSAPEIFFGKNIFSKLKSLKIGGYEGKIASVLSFRGDDFLLKKVDGKDVFLSKISFDNDFINADMQVFYDEVSHDLKAELNNHKFSSSFFGKIENNELDGELNLSILEKYKLASRVKTKKTKLIFDDGRLSVPNYDLDVFLSTDFKLSPYKSVLKLSIPEFDFSKDDISDLQQTYLFKLFREKIYEKSSDLRILTQVKKARYKENEISNLKIESFFGSKKGAWNLRVKADEINNDFLGKLEKNELLLSYLDDVKDGKMSVSFSKKEAPMLIDAFIPSINNIYGNQDNQFVLDFVTLGGKASSKIVVNNQKIKKIDIKTNILSASDLLKNWLGDKFELDENVNIAENIEADLSIYKKDDVFYLKKNKLVLDKTVGFIDGFYGKSSGFVANLNFDNLDLSGYQVCDLLVSNLSKFIKVNPYTKLLNKNNINIFAKKLVLKKLPNLLDFNVAIKGNKVKNIISGNARGDDGGIVKISGDIDVNRVNFKTHFSNFGIEKWISQRLDKNVVSGVLSGDLFFETSIYNFSSIFKKYKNRGEFVVDDFMVASPYDLSFKNKRNPIAGILLKGMKSTPVDVRYNFTNSLGKGSYDFNFVSKKRENIAHLSMVEAADKTSGRLVSNKYFDINFEKNVGSKEIDFSGKIKPFYGDKRYSGNFETTGKLEHEGKELKKLRFDINFKNFSNEIIRKAGKKVNGVFENLLFLEKKHIKSISSLLLEGENAIDILGDFEQAGFKSKINSKGVVLQDLGLEKIVGLDFFGKADFTALISGKYANPEISWGISPFGATVNHKRWRHVPNDLGPMIGAVKYNNGKFVSSSTNFEVSHIPFSFIMYGDEKEVKASVSLVNEILLKDARALLPFKEVPDGIRVPLVSQFKDGKLEKLEFSLNCDSKKRLSCLTNWQKFKKIKGEMIASDVLLNLAENKNKIRADKFFARLKNGVISANMKTLDKAKNDNHVLNANLKISGWPQKRPIIEMSSNVDGNSELLSNILSSISLYKNDGIEKKIFKKDFLSGGEGHYHFSGKFNYQNGIRELSGGVVFRDGTTSLETLGEVKDVSAGFDWSYYEDNKSYGRVRINDLYLSSDKFNGNVSAKFTLKPDAEIYSKIDGDIQIDKDVITHYAPKAPYEIKGEKARVKFNLSGGLWNKLEGRFKFDAGDLKINLKEPVEAKIKDFDEELIVNGFAKYDEDEKTVVLSNLSALIDERKIFTDGKLETATKADFEAKISPIYIPWFLSRFDYKGEKIEDGYFDGKVVYSDDDSYNFSLNLIKVRPSEEKEDFIVTGNVGVVPKKISADVKLREFYDGVPEVKISGILDNPFSKDAFFDANIIIPKIYRSAFSVYDEKEDEHINVLSYFRNMKDKDAFMSRFVLPKNGKAYFRVKKVYSPSMCRYCSLAGSFGREDKKQGFNLVVSKNDKDIITVATKAKVDDGSLKDISFDLNAIDEAVSVASDVYLGKDFDARYYSGNVSVKSNFKLFNELEDIKGSLALDMDKIRYSRDNVIFKPLVALWESKDGFGGAKNANYKMNVDAKFDGGDIDFSSYLASTGKSFFAVSGSMGNVFGDGVKQNLAMSYCGWKKLDFSDFSKCDDFFSFDGKNVQKIAYSNKFGRLFEKSEDKIRQIMSSYSEKKTIKPNKKRVIIKTEKKDSDSIEAKVSTDRALKIEKTAVKDEKIAVEKAKIDDFDDIKNYQPVEISRFPRSGSRK